MDPVFKSACFYVWFNRTWLAPCHSPEVTRLSGVVDQTETSVGRADASWHIDGFIYNRSLTIRFSAEGCSTRKHCPDCGPILALRWQKENAVNNSISIKKGNSCKKGVTS